MGYKYCVNHRRYPMILFTVNDRYNFESAVPTQDIRSRIHYISNSLTQMYGKLSFTVNPLHPEIDPIPMGPNQAYRLPHPVIDVSVEAQYAITPEIKILDTQDGFQIAISVNPGFLARAYTLLNFDEYMNLTHFSLNYEPYTLPQTRAAVMNVLYDQLPSLLGYIVWCNSRARSSITLGEPQEYTAQGSNADPTQYLGPIRDVTTLVIIRPAFLSVPTSGLASSVRTPTGLRPGFRLPWCTKIASKVKTVRRNRSSS